MEMICIGYLLGALTSIIFVGIGVCFGRLDNLDKGQSDNDNSGDVHSGGSDNMDITNNRDDIRNIDCG